ncbi:MAG: hypothetical protein ACRDHZ_07715 [Ktedonobacteraceae bacterium]
MAFVLAPVARGKVSRSFVVMSVATLVYVVVGAARLSGGVMQALFGLWVFAPLLYGLLVGPVLLDELRRFRHLILVLFWVACVGVVASMFVKFPWSGFAYNLAGSSIEASRQWGAFGVNRPAGFARASFSAAHQFLLFGIFLTVTAKSAWRRVLIWVVAGAGIVLTTSKGPAGAWLLVSLYLVTRRLGFRRSWNIVVILLAASIVVVPLSTLAVAYDPTFNNFSSQLLFTSFGDRLVWMWPRSFALLSGWTQWLTGIGLGGIGAPQLYFDTARYLPADNLFVYLCVDFGVLVALLFVAWVAFSAFGPRRHDHSLRLFTSPLLLATLAAGGTATIVEGATFAFFLGLSLAGATMARSEVGLWRLRGARAQARGLRE